MLQSMTTNFLSFVKKALIMPEQRDVLIALCASGMFITTSRDTSYITRSRAYSENGMSQSLPRMRARDPARGAILLNS